MDRATPIGLVPYMTIRDGRGSEALAFYEQAFGAQVLLRSHGGDMPGMPVSEKIIHARMRVNDALIFLSDDFPEWKGGIATAPPSAVTLHLQVEDVEMWWRRATDAGCTVVFPLADQPWGDRYGQVRDPFGHTWSV
ncbi:MAG TPA: glyoxalase/bleomycin resistance/extradiol dioxygenase family protein, partial [Caulobacteraceae bacterium]|nr:glyoxalase/bleomycin resistance/extradiol dioxygenase family protein [Caulobacteraceae bacterium]